MTWIAPQLMRRMGMVFQYGALFGSRTILENVSLPLREHTNLPEPVIREMVRMKLALVGLEGLEGRLPSDVSGGQRKARGAGRARRSSIRRSSSATSPRRASIRSWRQALMTCCADSSACSA